MPDNTFNLEQLLTVVTTGKILQALVVIGCAFILSQLVHRILHQWADQSNASRMRLLRIIPLFRVIIWCSAIWIILFPILQPEPAMLTAIIGGTALATGLAIQDTLKNIIGGFTLLADRPFQLGDKIQLGEHYGEVLHIGLRSVQLQTNDDTRIIVPNAHITTDAISNANSGATDFQVVAELYLPHTADLRIAERIAWEAAVSSPYVYLEKAVSIRIEEIFDNRATTKVRIKAYVLDTRLETLFHSDVIKRTKRAFQDAGLYTAPLA